jgi:magnesium-transporting ATPase (P-type)
LVNTFVTICKLYCLPAGFRCYYFLFFKDYLDAIAIGVVISSNAIIRFLMKMQAQSSMHALRKMDIIKSKVIREGKVLGIPAATLMPHKYFS